MISEIRASRRLLMQGLFFSNLNKQKIQVKEDLVINPLAASLVASKYFMKPGVRQAGERDQSLSTILFVELRHASGLLTSRSVIFPPHLGTLMWKNGVKVPLETSHPIRIGLIAKQIFIHQLIHSTPLLIRNKVLSQQKRYDKKMRMVPSLEAQKN